MPLPQTGRWEVSLREQSQAGNTLEKEKAAADRFCTHGHLLALGLLGKPSPSVLAWSVREMALASSHGFEASVCDMAGPTSTIHIRSRLQPLTASAAAYSLPPHSETWEIQGLGTSSW